MTFSNCEDYEALLGRYGYEQDEEWINYLRVHFNRFVTTRKLIYERWQPRPEQRLLDVGAHALLQTLMYALDGFEAVAADVPLPFTAPHARRLAEAFHIELFTYEDLSHPVELSSLPDSHFDIVLFSEILEHITFNPVEMWRQLYRLLKPGGRIVLTTPNFYSLDGRWFWELRRILKGRGGGLSVDYILQTNTMGPHWKEYCARELYEYFALLSPDFMISRTIQCNCYPPRSKLRELIQEWLKPMSQYLFVEVDLKEKKRGIVVEPHW